jgi:hypothetical protein
MCSLVSQLPENLLLKLSQLTVSRARKFRFSVPNFIPWEACQLPQSILALVSLWQICLGCGDSPEEKGEKLVEMTTHYRVYQVLNAECLILSLPSHPTLNFECLTKSRQLQEERFSFSRSEVGLALSCWVCECVVLYFFVWWYWVWTQGLVFARQTLPLKPCCQCI